MSDTPRTDAVISGSGVWTEQEVLIAHARTLERELAREKEALRDARSFVQDCLNRSHDRAITANLMSARDSLDAAQSKEPK